MSWRRARLRHKQMHHVSIKLCVCLDYVRNKFGGDFHVLYIGFVASATRAIQIVV